MDKHQRPDSLIFDMDGTLWNATHTYVEAWNEGFRKMKIDKVITYDDLAFVMGWNKRKALARLLPEYDLDMQDRIYQSINEARCEVIPRLGGLLYEGVKEGLQALAGKYQLFIVSNCPAGVIREFMKWADIESLIIDEMAHGANGMPKHHNIQLLIDKYQLKHPYYIGDTDIDSKESAIAGLPFVLLTYGFGSSQEYALKFDHFKDFTRHFMDL